MSTARIVYVVVSLWSAFLLCVTGCATDAGDVELNGAAVTTAAPSILASPQLSPTAAPQLSYDAFIDTLGQVDRRLRVEEEATYAGYCVPRPGRREATIAFTADAADTARAYVEGQPLAAYVSVRAADYPAALLDANARPEMERLYEMGFDVRGGVDYCRNRVVITVISPAEVEAALAAAGESLPPYVELVAGSMVTPES